MSVIDIRTEVTTVDEIVFTEKLDKTKNFNVAYKIVESHRRENMAEIRDGCGDYVLLPFEDIDNFIKALNKARGLWAK